MYCQKRLKKCDTPIKKGIRKSLKFEVSPPNQRQKEPENSFHNSNRKRKANSWEASEKAKENCDDLTKKSSVKKVKKDAKKNASDSVAFSPDVIVLSDKEQRTLNT